MAEHTKLSEAEVIRLHSQTPYHVHMIGFTAGFAYLGGLPEQLHTPRLSFAADQDAAGGGRDRREPDRSLLGRDARGWRLIGRTPVPLFHPAQDPPTPMVAGDRVRFVAVGREEYDRLEREYRTAAGSGQRADRHVGNRASGHPGGSESPSRPVAQSPLSSRQALEILRAGPLTTVQDRGRVGCQKFGVTVSGAMDEVALRVGNILVGNAQNAAALEISFLGPGDPVQSGRVAGLDRGRGRRGAGWPTESPGIRLSWRGPGRPWTSATAPGACAPTWLPGWIDVPVRLGSRSTSLAAGFGGTEGRPLCDGDVLSVGPIIGSPARWAGRTVPGTWRPTFASPQTIRVVLGPQDDAFTEVGRHTFLESSYEVSPSSDRMGCRLEGPAIEHAGAADIISDWIPLGGIQVPGNGKPIILLADRQTTGGYTKIATVIGPDIPKLAQVRPGDHVRFQALAIAEAQGVARTLERDLLMLDATLTDLTLWSDAGGMGDLG